MRMIEKHWPIIFIVIYGLGIITGICLQIYEEYKDAKNEQKPLI